MVMWLPIRCRGDQSSAVDDACQNTREEGHKPGDIVDPPDTASRVPEDLLDDACLDFRPIVTPVPYLGHQGLA